MRSFWRTLNMRRFMFLLSGPLWQIWGWGWFLHCQNSATSTIWSTSGTKIKAFITGVVSSKGDRQIFKHQYSPKPGYPRNPQGNRTCSIFLFYPCCLRNATMRVRKHEDSVLTKYFSYILKINYTQDITSINLFLPRLGRGYLTRVKPFLISKPLKPILHVLHHCQLVQRKRTRLCKRRGDILGETDLKPILWVQRMTTARRIKRGIS